MANQEHLDILKQGVEKWNQWRKNHPAIQPDLMDADFSDADLRGTILVNAKLFDADLSRADLSHALLIGTDLTHADLSYASLSDCMMGQARLSSVDLHTVKGLETTTFNSAPHISIETIYRSHGMISDIFLRNAGVPEDFITYMRSLVAHPIEYYTCFISHSSKDRRFCDRLYADLRGNSVRCWYFPEDAIWGEDVWGEIDRSIKLYDKLIVVCSKYSLQSVPVQREIERALSREDKEGKNILFPVRTDNCLFDGWEHPRKADILAKVVGDFRGWNRSAAKYETAFHKLLEALNAQESAQQ